MKRLTSETGLSKLEESRVILHFIRAPVITKYTRHQNTLKNRERNAPSHTTLLFVHGKV